MEHFMEGTYGPISVLFNAPVYEMIFKNIWNLVMYKDEVAIMVELMRLQNQNQVMCDITPEHMAQHLHEKSKNNLSVKFLDSQLEEFDDDVEVKLLLSLARVVNHSMRMRDIQRDAQSLLSAPELMPPAFRFPKITKKAQEIWETLTERHQQASSTERLQQPRDVVLEVVPKVVQVLWVPKQRQVLTMPSQELDKVAVGVTKAVEESVLASLGSTLQEITMSRSARDELIASIIETVDEVYLQDMWDTFPPQLLRHITRVAAKQITALFQHKPDANVSVESDTDAGPSEDVSQSTTPTPPMTADEDPAADEKVEPEENPKVLLDPPAISQHSELHPQEESDGSMTEQVFQPLHLSPASVMSSDGAPVADSEGPEEVMSDSVPASQAISSVPDSTCPPEDPEAHVSCDVEGHGSLGESAVMNDKSPKKKKSRMRRSIRWMQKRLFSCIWSQLKD
ncbi:uncharacterized protein LOC114481796 [Gouania willdenowi]|uniref:uncharacterized protein LOC114481796 n=1 Tax=Gouania willdenowi TaxID=441366 RepID=UPI00105580EE|nr:uncharacterized protein LOC114481796 [Gouania willdenowi]